MRHRFAHTIACFAVMLSGWITGTGCGADAGARDTRDNEAARQQLSEALRHLANHRIRRARDIYDDLLEEPNGIESRAAAGRAVTNLLLIPTSPPVDTILTQHLGASAPLESTDVIYGDQGYLYWRSRGVQWEKSGEYAGIKTLLVDRLPWSEKRLESLAAFVEGRTRPVGDAIDPLTRLASRLRGIEGTIERVLADSDFKIFVLPGVTLQEQRLTLRLGPSEFAVIGAAMATARAVIRFTSAYVHDWTLERAFGSHWRRKAESDEGDHPEWNPRDYTIDYLDRHLGREFREERDRHLRAAREASRRALAFFVDAIDRGQNQERETALRWEEVNPEYATDLRETLDALRGALGESTRIPTTEPTTRLDLSVFFDPGRTLDSEINWWVPAPEDERMGGSSGNDASSSIRWTWNDRAIQRFAVDGGVFDPEFEVSADEAPEWTRGGASWNNFRSNLVGPTRRAVEEAFFRGR